MFFPLPLQHRVEYRSVVWLESRSCYAITAPNIDTLYFKDLNSDSTFSHLSLECKDAETVLRCQGFWYSPVIPIHFCHGRILTTSEILASDSLSTYLQANLYNLLNTNNIKIRKTINKQRHFQKEMQYYMLTHNVQDEGFNQLANLHHAQNLYNKEYAKMARTLRKLLDTPLTKVTFMTNFTYRYVLLNGKLSTKARPCILYKRYKDSRVIQLQATSHAKAFGTVSLGYPLVNLMRFSSPDLSKEVTLHAFNLAIVPDSLSVLKISATKGKAWKEKNKDYIQTSLPVLPYAVGAPVVDRRGVLIGLADRSGIVPIP